MIDSAHGQHRARRRGFLALGLGVFAVGSAVVGFAVGPLFFLALLGGVAGVALAVNALRAAHDNTTKICAVSAIVLGLLASAAVVWLIVAFIVNPPE